MSIGSMFRGLFPGMLLTALSFIHSSVAQSGGHFCT